MKTLICTMLAILSSQSVMSQPIEIKCWAGNNLIYHKTISDKNIRLNDAYIVVYDNGIAEMIEADCIMKSRLPTHKKKHSK